jgi:hypothetical protein
MEGKPMNITYWLSRLGRAGVLGALALTGCGEGASTSANAEKEPELKLIYTVDKVTIKRLAKTPPALVLEVEGTASSAGWENISLEPAMIEDDTLTYQLMGTPPEEMAAQMLTPVKASRIVDPLPDGTAKIRVIATQNEIVEPVPE